MIKRKLKDFTGKITVLSGVEALTLRAPKRSPFWIF